jgi:hypothetical protein
MVIVENIVSRVQPRLSYREAWDSGLPASQSSINGLLGGAQRVGGPVDMPNNRPSGRILRQREEVRWLVMWGEDDTEVGDMWEKLARVCNDGQVLRSVYKIEAVRQNNGRTRFDIYCNRAWESRLMEYMRRHAQRLGWYTRRHIPWDMRRGRSEAVSGSSGNVRTTRIDMRLGTYNINGVRSKICDLRRFVQAQSMDCLAIQETGLTARDRSLRLPGYHCFQVCGDRMASQRGVALALRTGWSGHVVGTPTPWFMLVRVFGKGMGNPMIIGCVYLPHGADRSTVRLQLIAEIQQIQHVYPQDKIIIMGDWNEAMPDSTIVGDMGEGWGLVPQSVNVGTRKANNRVIDFMITNSQGTFEQAKVHQQWDCSDHYPVTTKAGWQVQSTSLAPASGGAAPKRRIHVDKVALPKKGCPPAMIPKQFLGIVDDNYWNPLIEDLEVMDEFPPPSTSIHQLADKFCETVFKVADGNGILVEATQRDQTALPRHIVRAIDLRCKAYRETKDTSLPVDTRPQRRERYEVLKATCRRKVRRFQMDRWRKTLKKAETDIVTDPRRYWRWASSLAGWRRKASCTGAQPMKHPVTGELLTEARSINDAWRTHYANLARDETGHSRESVEYWNERLGMGPSRICLLYTSPSPRD